MSLSPRPPASPPPARQQRRPKSGHPSSMGRTRPADSLRRPHTACPAHLSRQQLRPQNQLSVPDNDFVVEAVQQLGRTRTGLRSATLDRQHSGFGQPPRDASLDRSRVGSPYRVNLLDDAPPRRVQSAPSSPRRGTMRPATAGSLGQATRTRLEVTQEVDGVTKRFCELRSAYVPTCRGAALRALASEGVDARNAKVQEARQRITQERHVIHTRRSRPSGPRLSFIRPSAEAVEPVPPTPPPASPPPPEPTPEADASGDETSRRESAVSVTKRRSMAAIRDMQTDFSEMLDRLQRRRAHSLKMLQEELKNNESPQAPDPQLLAAATAAAATVAVTPPDAVEPTASHDPSDLADAEATRSSAPARRRSSKGADAAQLLERPDWVKAWIQGVVQEATQQAAATRPDEPAASAAAPIETNAWMQPFVEGVVQDATRTVLETGFIAKETTVQPASSPLPEPGLEDDEPVDLEEPVWLEPWIRNLVLAAFEETQQLPSPATDTSAETADAAHPAPSLSWIQSFVSAIVHDATQRALQST
ncbi:uncharacterized protein MONBRDRAFT_8161 [Monosiga brevicollis MX1]|uniref:Uncharacterized protein n=1 Tax=Monosiga brevicollis TaxID=81824 RepID=A9UZ79_MONBE|nr:uncharacterized protein MONBRDRAFT_8161 [Monosiga brevicollis MX1]EDQ89319.1 predicted protein [Monosiga brevicollis MX1]|eukprot:XP_001745895.1 hypothetical protein [Monosiga brevicollis MX1]